MESGRVLRSRHLGDSYFGEGLERVGERLIQLTWNEKVAFVYDLETFQPLDTFSYGGEGWGLCFDGERLFMSNGSDTLLVREPEQFLVVDQKARSHWTQGPFPISTNSSVLTAPCGLISGTATGSSELIPRMAG